jgi:lipoyl(octanoyl) transferase
MEVHKVSFSDLGLIGYKECWDHQLGLFNEMVGRKLHNRDHPKEIRPTESTLIFCEHPHVYTLGKSGSEDNLLLDDTGLKVHGASFYRINRGGDITYHGPGQLVCYPIFDLDHFFTDIHRFIDHLEDAIIATLSSYGLVAGKGPTGYTGVWLDWDDPIKARKICAFGMHTSRWVTMHGFALNVNTDLSYYRHIVPCGIPDRDVTSMQRELGFEVEISEVKARLLSELNRALGLNLRAA